MQDNRYTRLKAISEFGYDIDWDDLKKRHVGIVGVGGLGTVSAEMAVRCGIGKISLFDFDKVEEVNLNRSLFKPKHIGLLKVNVAKKTYEEINPDVKVLVYGKNIMEFDFEPIFEEKIKEMDIILNGLDNVTARDYLNVKCVKFRLPLIDAGASRSGLNGYVQTIIPYETPCSACLKRISFKLPSETAKPCTASLPSTMAILASIQIQEMLKYLLNFGKRVGYIMYNMLTGAFTEYNVSRAENCLICGDKKIRSKDLI